MLLDGFAGVMRTRWVKTAIIPQQGAEKKLIAANHNKENLFHLLTVTLPKLPDKW